MKTSQITGITCPECFGSDISFPVIVEAEVRLYEVDPNTAQDAWECRDNKPRYISGEILENAAPADLEVDLEAIAKCEACRSKLPLREFLELSDEGLRGDVEGQEDR